MNRTAIRLAAAVLGLVAPIAAVAAPAQAGGAPPYVVGEVTVDARATLSGNEIQLTGSYTCEGAGERIGFFYGDVRDRAGAVVAAFEQDGLDCDGASHAWSLTIQRSAVASGPLWVHGMLQVCESVGGDCPGTLFDQRVVAVPSR